METYKRYKVNRAKFNAYAKGQPPHYGKIVRKMIGKDGKVFIISFNDTYGRIAADSMDAILGCATIPIDCLVQ